MPHIFTLATPAGNEEIDRLWTNAGDEIFDDWLERVVPEVVQEEAEETWDGNVRVVSHDRGDTTTMPVALAIVILLWGSDRQRRVIGHIERSMHERLTEAGFELPASIQVLGVPSADEEIDPIDFGSGRSLNA